MSNTAQANQTKRKKESSKRKANTKQRKSLGGNEQLTGLQYLPTNRTERGSNKKYICRNEPKQTAVN